MSNSNIDELAYAFWSIHPKDLEPYKKSMPEGYKGGVRAWYFSCEMLKLLDSRRTLIGWVPINQDGSVYQATVSNAYQGGRGSTRKGVRKFYPTENRAAAYSPVKLSKPIYMEP